MSRSVIFLDIEGILVTKPSHPVQPDTGIACRLANELNLPALATLPDLLISQILEHFNHKACAYIEKLCQERNAEIVLTSSWRHFHSLSQLKAIFHMLGISALADTVSSGCVRREIIQKYLQTHEIQSYIVLDDIDLSRVFGYRFIQCQKGFLNKQFEQAMGALACQQISSRSAFAPNCGMISA